MLPGSCAPRRARRGDCASSRKCRIFGANRKEARECRSFASRLAYSNSPLRRSLFVLRVAYARLASGPRARRTPRTDLAHWALVDFLPEISLPRSGRRRRRRRFFFGSCSSTRACVRPATTGRWFRLERRGDRLCRAGPADPETNGGRSVVLVVSPWNVPAVQSSSSYVASSSEPALRRPV